MSGVRASAVTVSKPEASPRAARHTLAIHFATFAGSDDEASWPLDLLRKARHAADVPHFEDEGGFGYVDVGATVSVRPDA
jgi:hypothetical protein